MTVRLSLAETLPKGKPATLTFVYGGKLTGAEESPVWGIKFAAIHPDFAYLMYPARWFPVNDYTADRFTTDLKVTVPSGYKVIASGLDSADLAADGKTAMHFSSRRRLSRPALQWFGATRPPLLRAASPPRCTSASG